MVVNRFSVGVVGAAFMIAAAGCSSSDVAVDDVEETVASVVEASEPEEISEETEASEETGTESDSSETSATETDDESSSGQATDTAQTSGTETDQPSSSSDSQESETTTSVEAMEPESDQGEDSESVFYLTTLWSLTIEEEQPRSGYDRDSWPHWRDTNGTGCDSRKDLLIMYAYKNNDEGDETIDVTDCVVVDGMWFSWYDATETSNSSSLDVDHIVSLAEAHDSGGANWSRSQKQEFANYLGNLILTSASTNRSKSDKDLGEWKPPYQAVWCVTAQQTVAVKSMFGLSVDQREHDALEEMLDTCNAGGQTSWRHASAYSSIPAKTNNPPTINAPITRKNSSFESFLVTGSAAGGRHVLPVSLGAAR